MKRWLDALLHLGEIADLRDTVTTAHTQVRLHRDAVRARDVRIKALSADLLAARCQTARTLAYCDQLSASRRCPTCQARLSHPGAQ